MGVDHPSAVCAPTIKSGRWAQQWVVSHSLTNETFMAPVRFFTHPQEHTSSVSNNPTNLPQYEGHITAFLRTSLLPLSRALSMK